LEAGRKKATGVGLKADGGRKRRVEKVRR